MTLNSNDTQFNLLRIWNDVDNDGVVDGGELISLTEAGISSISLKAQSDINTISGNTTTEISSITMTDGTTRNIYEVLLGVDKLNSGVSNPDEALGTDFELINLRVA